ncbi:RecB family exonuclease [Alkanindiges illinoisensis]|uniref:PD-(D/E)XK nuclease family protein n=1 Tax=Alkanindiges illinoisensis TaxID=197183 RepID=A0A4Y7X923_9GAMM|nr:PD-(D/E)XK nuclease family protein [Alkanindiges illinoisensis]TEU23343.1 PD-(D/E)XK nuclease family protein [Alkanindiges illinoisensis]
MNAPFSIRASSLSELFDCPARWETKNVLGRRLPIGGAGRMGTAIHEATTLHDYAVMNETTVSLDDCDTVLVDAIWNPNEDVDWTDTDQQTAETTGRALIRKYISDIAGTQHYIGVEVRAEALTLADIGITLTGTIDRIYQHDNGQLGIGDIKTGKTACSADGTVKTAGHGVQMGVYTLLAEHALNEQLLAPARIYGLTTGKTAKGQHAGVGEIPDPMDALLGSDDRHGLLHHAGQILKNGLFYGNPKSTLCSAKFCPAHQTCPFRK